MRLSTSAPQHLSTSAPQHLSTAAVRGRYPSSEVHGIRIPRLPLTTYTVTILAAIVALTRCSELLPRPGRTTRAARLDRPFNVPKAQNKAQHAINCASHIRRFFFHFAAAVSDLGIANRRWTARRPSANHSNGFMADNLGMSMRRLTPCEFGRINWELLHAAPSQTRPLTTPSPSTHGSLGALHFRGASFDYVDTSDREARRWLQSSECPPPLCRLPRHHPTADSFMAPSPLSPDPSAPAACVTVITTVQVIAQYQYRVPP
ncbi:hypothetical protein CSOJ01_06987 [Colletotrichum sojae]|uniref:Uncharacterized protein n=1 Tax=Colletotrichum sojae TaxID=2175907 RepID=A0A8H6JAB6_9PEZI|nr:hypothetical protein CSOJ01_06987 [Colletotrichum sojae]